MPPTNTICKKCDRKSKKSIQMSRSLIWRFHTMVNGVRCAHCKVVGCKIVAKDSREVYRKRLRRERVRRLEQRKKMSRNEEACTSSNSEY